MLFSSLLSEGVLAETVLYDSADQPIEMVVFSYERLADHLVMSYLLEKHADPTKPKDAFLGGQPLGALFADENACWQKSGAGRRARDSGSRVLGHEIFELVPSVAVTRPICEAFIESLLWRDASTLTDRCLPFINEHILQDSDLDRKLLNVLLSVAPNPEHPFNADFLHNNLISRELAGRDAWWSIFLYEEYGRRGSVDRIVDWAWSDADKSHISDDAIRLIGKALIWFLSTSHRFLRDRATKAIVSLFIGRIEVLCSEITDFLQVNDPYVLERLFAVAYGCALRSTDLESIRKLGQLVYDTIFREGSPPCDVLMRDYARGVIEVAVHMGVDPASADVNKIRPPYNSEWPLTIPSPEELETYGKWSKDMPGRSVGVAFHICLSVGTGCVLPGISLGSDRGVLPWSRRLIRDPRYRVSQRAI